MEKVGRGGGMSAFNARRFGSVRVHWRSGRSRPNGWWSIGTYTCFHYPANGPTRLEFEVIHHEADKGRSGRCRLLSIDARVVFLWPGSHVEAKPHPAPQVYARRSTTGVTCYPQVTHSPHPANLTTR